MIAYPKCDEESAALFAISQRLALRGLRTRSASKTSRRYARHEADLFEVSQSEALRDRDYVVNIGYRCSDGRWLSLTRSAPVRIPPEYPSDWIEEQFVTVNFDEELRGRTVYELGSPTKGMTAIHDKIFNLSQSGEEQRVTGSLFGSMQQVPISSFVFPSGIGMWSGVGFSASMPPLRPRKFWLVADAELIVHGATEPDAKVTIQYFSFKPKIK